MCIRRARPRAKARVWRDRKSCIMSKEERFAARALALPCPGSRVPLLACKEKGLTPVSCDLTSTYGIVKGPGVKVHIFRRFGFTKALHLCIPVMSPFLGFTGCEWMSSIGMADPFKSSAILAMSKFSLSPLRKRRFLMNLLFRFRSYFVVVSSIRCVLVNPLL